MATDVSVQLTNDKNRLTELVRTAQAGDRNSFGKLVEHYQRTVFREALRRLGNHAEAQELCRDVFVQALIKLHQLQNPICFGGWLRSITHRMSINRAVRRRAATAIDPDALSNICVERQTPLASVFDRERRSQVRNGLVRLRAMDRDTLTAFYVHGQSLIEMSDTFDAPVGTIKRRLHVARKRLAKEVEGQVAV